MINLFQIADPHFGELFSNSKVSRVSGRRIHHIDLCRALQRFFRFEVPRVAGVDLSKGHFLAMNGDLTEKGAERQFEVANTFLFSKHTVVSQQVARQIGLAHPRSSEDGQKDLYAGIPGNHDHGDGRWDYPLVKGYGERIYERFLDLPPFVRRFWTSDGVELCVFGIDSCSVFEEEPPNLNPLADGGFSSSHRTAFLELLREELRKPLAEGCHLRTAVILCHHPFQADGLAGPLYKESGIWLANVAARFGIRMVFTGHTHRSWTEEIRFQDFLDVTQKVREVRCPTTLQGPAELDERKRSPGIWWHRISAEGDQIIWRGSLCIYTKEKNSFKVLIENVDQAANDDSVERPELVEWYKEEIPNLEPIPDDWGDEIDG